MSHLRLYRLAFAPALAALVVIAFSLDGVPSPIEPPPGTTEFDADSAAASAREVLALGPTRKPGSPTDSAAADLVRDRFSAVVAGDTAEQEVEAEIDGEDVTLRNVTLTLRGASDRTILVIASRDSRDGAGGPSSAAATGTLLELADKLAVTSRNHTVVLASTSGGSAEGQGARALIDALPDRTEVDAAIVIYQPGYDDPYGPYLVDTAGQESPPTTLVETATALLEDRAQTQTQRIGLLGQIARFAIPAAVGEQAGLGIDGVDAVAISSAGELPLPPGSTDSDRLAGRTLDRFGPAIIALVAALDTSLDPPASGPSHYLRVGDNLIPGWSVGLLALALLIPPFAVGASVLAGERRGGADLRRAFAIAAEWLIPVAALLGILYVLGLAGVIPSSGVPYDPARYGIGVGEALALVLLVGVALWVWWILGLRKVHRAPGPLAVGAAATVTATLTCVLAWIFNPYLALVLMPLPHLGATLALAKRRQAAAIAVCVAVALPLLLAIAYVASAFGWGVSAPWQLAVLAAGGGIPLWQVAPALATVALAGAILFAAVASPVRPEPDRRRPGYSTPDGA